MASHWRMTVDASKFNNTLISVGRMALGGEWSRFRKKGNYSSLLEKNSPDISLFYSEGRYSFRSHRCE
jgi:hypothetical protein